MLPKCKEQEEVLVIVDCFSRWVEAYPTKKGTAQHTKILIQEIIPRWGFPEQLDSDQGTHFTGKVCQKVARLLNIDWQRHCPYHPQSSGQVECTN
jgi:hypothetical protein